jgi:hypothetical protein
MVFRILSNTNETIQSGAEVVCFGVRQLAAALGPIDGLRRGEDESGSKLPHSKECNARRQ